MPLIFLGNPTVANIPSYASFAVGLGPSFGEKEYTTTTSANVISTAANAALTVSDPGHLTNGTFSLPEALRVEFTKSAWTAPVANDPVTIPFRQHIATTDALRTGAYSRTLTFTLATTTP